MFKRLHPAVYTGHKSIKKNAINTAALTFLTQMSWLSTTAYIRKSDAELESMIANSKVYQTA